MRNIKIITNCPHCWKEEIIKTIKGIYKIVLTNIYICECTNCLKLFWVDVQRWKTTSMKCTNWEWHDFSLITWWRWNKIRKKCAECGTKKLHH